MGGLASYITRARGRICGVRGLGLDESKSQICKTSLKLKWRKPSIDLFQHISIDTEPMRGEVDAILLMVGAGIITNILEL